MDDLPLRARAHAPAAAHRATAPLEGVHVGIDGYNLALEEGTGVATYARSLSCRLGELGARVGVLYGRPAAGHDDLSREISFFDPVEDRSRKWIRTLRHARQAIGALGGVRARPIRLSGAVIAEDFRARLPCFDEIFNVNRLFQLAIDYFDVFDRPLKVVFEQPPAVMHWTYPLPIEAVGARNIYTLHDLVPLRLPHTTLDSKRRYLKVVRLLARRADHLVTVSEASRRDIIELLKVAPERVTNTYQSAELPAGALAREPESIAAEIGGVFGLPYQGYFLFFGAIEPKKNVGRLIQAYLAGNVSAPLVIVGKLAWKSAQELRLLGIDEARAELGRLSTSGSSGGSRIVRIDYVPQAMLISLIRGAKAVLFPSLYEGFGLPVLEAMSLGAPVITSNTSSLPEVAGEAALQVDPYDPAALAEAIGRLDRDADLRRELSARGERQAARFSKQAYSERLVELYRRIGVAKPAAPRP